MKSIYLIKTPSGGLISETLSFNKQNCINTFVNSCIKLYKATLTIKETDVLWGAYQREGFKVKQIDLSQQQIEEFHNE